jgi:hypothetical protein
MAAGLRIVFATMRKTGLAPVQKKMLKITTSVTGSGLSSGGEDASGAIKTHREES